MKTSSAQRRLQLAQEEAMNANLALEEAKEILAIVKVHRPVHSQDMRQYVLEWLEGRCNILSDHAQTLNQKAADAEFWIRSTK